MVFTRELLLRKVAACLLVSLIFAPILSYVHGYSPAFIYFIYLVAGTLVIGAPCSIAVDFVLRKFQPPLFKFLLGLIIHLVLAEILVALFMMENFSLFQPLSDYDNPCCRFYLDY